MAKPVIEIQFPYPTTPDLMSQTLNLIEDIYRDTKESGVATVDEIDSYGTGRFVITVISTRRLGEANSIINRRIQNSRFADVAQITRLDLVTKGH